jgi:dolichyl-phosphate-mannose--protein O-mannosyl transferase
VLERIRLRVRSVALSKNFGWLSTLLLTILGAILRFGNLANPKQLVFDETYYVKDAYTLQLFGSERNWEADPNPAFESGDLTGYLDSAAYVVHPPIGKWLISLGMQLFGADSSFGWRFATAILGTLAIPLIILIAYKLIGSKVFAALAGLFLAIDGQAIVMSRTAILDGILAFFVLLAFYLLVVDDNRFRKRLSQKAIRLSFRPLLFLMGIVLGLAAGTKWSGLYFVAAFGLYTFLVDLYQRQKLGRQPAWAFAQGFINALTLFVGTVGTYVLGWLGWILGSDGWGRNAKSNWWESLWSYHQNAFTFHTGLSSPHPYQANALEWLVLVRPTAFYFEKSEDCGQLEFCTAAITALPHPLIWFAGISAIIWLLFRFFRTFDKTAGLILVGFLAGWAPWLAYLTRTTFQFYTVVVTPFLILALVYALYRYRRRGFVLGRLEARERTLVLFVFLSIVLAVYFSSLWMGFEVPYWIWRIQMWLPNWI